MKSALTIAAVAACLAGCTSRTVGGDLRPQYELPRLADDLVIDGDGAEWSAASLRLSVFTEDGVTPIDPLLFSAEAQLGWNVRGLVVAVHMRSNQPWEESADARLAYQADSVELFLRRGGAWKDLVQPVIAPGMAPDQDAARCFVYDYRGGGAEWTGLATGIEFVRQRQADGFTLEALIPWAQLQLPAELGTTCEFAIKLNKVLPSLGRRQLSWSGPTGDIFQRLRLAGPGAATVGRAAWIVRDGPDRVAACVLATHGEAGASLSLRRGEDELLRTPLCQVGNRAAAWVSIPAPTPGGQPLILCCADEEVCRFEVQDGGPALRRRLEAAASLPWWYGEQEPGIAGLRFRVPAILSVAALPTPACDDPVLARAAGVVGTTVRWYGADGAAVERAERPGRYGAVITVRCADGSEVVFRQTCVRLGDDLQSRGLMDDALRRLGATVAVDPAGVQLRDQLGLRLADQLTADRDVAPLLAGLLESAVDGQPPRAAARDRAWWHRLGSSHGDATTYRWFRRLPNGYGHDPDRRWPAVIYLHGSGGLVPRDYKPYEQRDPEADLLGWVKDKDLPLAIYALQASNPWEPPAVLAALDRILAEDRIDPDRVVLMGFSMGGFGTWDCIVDHPERFAGAVPIGGRGFHASDVAGIAGRLPVWVFNGDKDNSTTLEDAQVVVRTLQAAGGEVRLTVLPGADHGASQAATYATPGLWDWVLQRRRGTTP